MESRDCKFCLQAASYAPLERMREMDVEIFFCHHCQAEYLYWFRGGNASVNFFSWSLYVNINNKMFRWTVGNDGHGQLWRVKEPGIPGIRANRGMEAVYYVRDASGMDINPQNIESKVRAWLPFL